MVKKIPDESNEGGFGGFIAKARQPANVVKVFAAIVALALLHHFFIA